MKRAFGNTSSSDEEDDDFKKYIKKKTLESQKKSEEATMLNLEINNIENCDMNTNNNQAVRSQFIGKILESKKIREIDNLQRKSQINHLRIHLEQNDFKNDQVYITPNYKSIKENLDAINEINNQEGAQQNTELYFNSYQFDPMILGIKNDEIVTTSTGPMLKDSSKPIKKIFQNDVYKVRNYKVISTNTLNNSNTDNERILQIDRIKTIEDFLASTKTQEQLKQLKDAYLERKNIVIK